MIFKITNAKLYVQIATLSAEDNGKLSKLLSEGFKRTVYWKKYKMTDNKMVEIVANNEETPIRELLDSSLPEVKRFSLFLLIIIRKAIIKFLLIFRKNILFQDLK